MKSFSYLAYTANGKRRAGQVVAEDAAAASRKLRADGLFPEKVTEGAARGGAGRQRRLDNDLQALFARQMAVMLSAGLPVDQALEVVRTAGSARAIEEVATRVRGRVIEGAALSEALVKGASGFPPYVTSAIRAGEAARDLAAVFETVAEHLETRRTDRAVLATALVYPVFVAVAACIVCGVLMVTVAPEIAAMFETMGRPLPPLTAFLLGTTLWIQHHLWLLLPALAAMILGIPLLLRRPQVRDRWQRTLLRLPVVSRLMTLAAAAQYLRTLALVVASRQPVVEGVRSARDVLTVARFRAEADAVTRAVDAGAPLSASLAHASFIPVVARQLVEAGEKSARVARMTERAAVLVETWLDNDRKRIATLLDPALMMLIGAFVLVVVLSILLPIFDMQGAIGL